MHRIILSLTPLACSHGKRARKRVHRRGEHRIHHGNVRDIRAGANGRNSRQQTAGQPRSCWQFCVFALRRIGVLLSALHRFVALSALAALASFATFTSSASPASSTALGRPAAGRIEEGLDGERRGSRRRRARAGRNGDRRRVFGDGRGERRRGAGERGEEGGRNHGNDGRNGKCRGHGRNRRDGRERRGGRNRRWMGKEV